MLDKDMYDLVFSSAAELGDAQRLELKGPVLNALGSPVRAIFPGFAAAFPETASVIEEIYATPIVLFKKYRGTWMGSMVAEGARANLFFNLVAVELEVEGAGFESEYAMLPARWKELYRYFWSFEVTDDSYNSMDWFNTPFSYSGRLTIERYRVLRGVKKSTVNDFINSTKAGSQHSLRCWLLTDSGDALFIDEGKCDRKVYHVKNDDFAGYHLIEDPETVLDKYLAHFLRTQSSDGFDFRG